VALSLQLPFAVVPLLRLTNSKSVMGEYTNSSSARWAASVCAGLVVTANLFLVLRTAREMHAASPLAAYVFSGFALMVFVFLLRVLRTPLRVGVERESRDYAVHLAQRVL
jgi:hypothetical protein